MCCLTAKCALTPNLPIKFERSCCERTHITQEPPSVVLSCLVLSSVTYILEGIWKIKPTVNRNPNSPTIHYRSDSEDTPTFIIQHYTSAWMNLRELRAELRKLGLPTNGRKSELEQRLADDARNKALDKDTAASSIEGVEDKLVQGAEKPDRMKRVRHFAILRVVI